MDVDSSESRSLTTGGKYDSQPTSVNINLVAEGSGNEDKVELDSDKIINKTNDTTDGNSQNEATSTTMNRIPKPEFQFRNETCAINDGNGFINIAATKLNSPEVEIKQEDSCHSPNTPLPSHAVSKIQVCFCILKICKY